MNEMSAHRRIILLVLAVFSLSINFSFQNPSNQAAIISSEPLRQDFKVFRESIEQLHAGLYRYKHKKEIDRLFDSGYSVVNKSMPIIEYYLLLRYLISSIQDGHTSCSLPPELTSRYVDNAKMFPVQLRFINNKAYIPCSMRPGTLPIATEVIAIDNKSVDVIRDKLFSYLPSDGSNQTKKFWDLNNEAFVPLYFLVFGTKSSFSIRHQSADGKLRTTNLTAEFFKNVECRTIAVKNPKYLQLDYKPNKIAILTIKTFAGNLLRHPNEFSDFLEASFKDIRNKKIEKLIIDLRDNGGGHDVYGSMLYSYLTDRPFEYYASLESNTRKFEIEDHPNLGIQKPAQYNYRGKVFFLINGKSFSTTAEFCSIAKSNARGIFIGEETGGGYYGNTSGANAQIILPNSKIVVNIPKTKYIMAVKEAEHKDRGIIPDFPIVPSIKDVVRKRDVQLYYALRLAGG